ncbi:hypothetical protein [Hyalangium rubrum]|uniref:Lipoprotein n=1 Tax=Hyalangium rubrum TaxID=3103134 RepID=A0ABU5GW80_9BACT|nr:hypothetical protein [Hyalangium sp. s54d21]MDY7225435.1 hypothetical protein [Hyalangium sp. s54d21]
MARVVLCSTLSVVLLAACYGPKGSPDGTIKSFFSAAESHNWEDMAEMVDPESLAKVGSIPGAAAFYESTYGSNTDIDLTILELIEVKPDVEAVVKFKCRVTFRELGKMPYSAGCSDTYTLRAHDGKWFIVLPETQRLRPTL